MSVSYKVFYYYFIVRTPSSFVNFKETILRERLPKHTQSQTPETPVAVTVHYES